MVWWVAEAGEEAKQVARLFKVASISNSLLKPKAQLSTDNCAFSIKPLIPRFCHKIVGILFEY